MCSIDSNPAQSNYNIVLECFWLEVKRESILIRNCKIIRISFISLGFVKFKTLLSSVLIKTVITKNQCKNVAGFFLIFRNLRSNRTKTCQLSAAKPALLAASLCPAVPSVWSTWAASLPSSRAATWSRSRCRNVGRSPSVFSLPGVRPVGTEGTHHTSSTGLQNIRLNLLSL